jgi:hypothetical protein
VVVLLASEDHFVSVVLIMARVAQREVSGSAVAASSFALCAQAVRPCARPALRSGTKRVEAKIQRAGDGEIAVVWGTPCAGRAPPALALVGLGPAWKLSERAQMPFCPGERTNKQGGGSDGKVVLQNLLPK